MDRPQTLTALNVTDTSALLLWQPCAATVDSYVITYSAESGEFLFHSDIIRVERSPTGAPCPAVSPIVEHVSGSTLEFEMGALVPGTRYKAGVYAVKDALKSNPTVTEFTTGRGAPQDSSTAASRAHLQFNAAFADVDPPRDLKAVNIQTDSATLTWRPPQAAVTGYTLTFSSADGVIRVRRLHPLPTHTHTRAQISPVCVGFLTLFWCVRVDPGGGAEPDSVLLQHGSAGWLHRVQREAAGHRRGPAEPPHRHRLHHQ